MRCPNCGSNQEDRDVCSDCGYKLNPVQILTPEERENFVGTTIEEEHYDTFQGYNRQGRYQAYVVWTSGGLLSVLSFIGVVLALLFFALPLAIAVVFIFAVYKLLKK